MTRHSGHVVPVAALALALALAACGSAPPTTTGTTSGQPSTGASVSPRATGSWTPQPVEGGIATDQDCTARSVLSGDMAPAGLAPHELQAMAVTLPSQVVPSDTTATGPAESGFLDNADLGWQGTLGDDSCDVMARTGRVTGYFATWDSGSGVAVTSTVHAFLSEQGADDFLAWLPQAAAGGRGQGYFFDNRGDTVVDVKQGSVVAIGADTAAAELVLTSASNRMLWVAFRVGSVVSATSVAGPIPTIDTMSSAQIAERAVRQVRAVSPTGSPYDLVTLLSAPVPKAKLGDEFRRYTWDYCCSGLVEEWQVAESLTNPMDPSRRAAEGWVGGARGQYSAPAEDGSAPVGAVSSGLVAYRTAAGARASRATLLQLARDGTSAAKPAKTFVVLGVDDADGLITLVTDQSTYQETRVVLPVHGSVILSAVVRDRVGVDHRSDATRIARMLHERWHTLNP